MNKISRRKFLQIGLVTGAALAVPWQVFAQTPPPPKPGDKLPYRLPRRVKVTDRQAAAQRAAALGLQPGAAAAPAVLNPGGIPHYFGYDQNNGVFSNGSLDEIRISTAARCRRTFSKRTRSWATCWSMIQRPS